MRARELRRPSHTAYHEAGHAVACWAFDVPVIVATIISNPEEGYSGIVRKGSLPQQDRLERHEKQAVICFAGPAAQRRSHPRSGIVRSAKYDHMCTDLLAEMMFEAVRPRRTFLRRAAEEARGLVDRHWYAIDRVARELQRNKALSGFAVTRIVKEAEAVWAQVSGYHPDLTAHAYARQRAIARQALPPLRRRHLAEATLRATLAGVDDVEAAVIAELTTRGYCETACRAEWTRAAQALATSLRLIPNDRPIRDPIAGDAAPNGRFAA